MTSSRVNVATYNALSSHLCSAEYYASTKPEYCEPSYRLHQLFSKLESQVATGAVICLQEISITWDGPLTEFFLRRGYCFIPGRYGKKFNGYMGVAVAVPLQKYEVNDVDITTIADTKFRPRSPKPTFAQNFIRSIFVNPFYGVLKMLGLWTRSFSPWDEACWRQNQMVTVRLTPRSLSGAVDASLLVADGAEPKKSQSFVVGTYHMPCAFYLPALMMIHSALSTQHIQKFAKSDPYVFAGDFNIKPSDPMYTLLTEGAMPTDTPDVPPNEAGDEKFKMSVRPMRSAYKEKCGSEPALTNWAKTSRPGSPLKEFTGTLDYVFISPEWVVEDVQELPSQETAGGPFPSQHEPSDHLLLATSLTFPAAHPHPAAEV